MCRLNIFIIQTFKLKNFINKYYLLFTTKIPIQKAISYFSKIDMLSGGYMIPINYYSIKH